MAGTIQQSRFDTPKVVEDKVRALPQNQGKSDREMWALIDAEILSARRDGMLFENERYVPINKHGT